MRADADKWESSGVSSTGLNLAAGMNLSNKMLASYTNAAAVSA
jgi:hypothetical protein